MGPPTLRRVFHERRGVGRAQRALGAEPMQPPPTPGHMVAPLTPEEVYCKARRVLMAGGALNNVLSDPMIDPFEQLFRRLPEQGIHAPDISPQRPFRFNLGSFRVPEEETLVLFDFRPDIYRFSGVDPNDAVPVAARRFATQIGYEVTINGRHPGNLRFELEPIPRQSDNTEFELDGVDILNNPGFTPGPAAFEQARSNSFGAATGAGLSTLPQRPFRYGAPSLPLALVVDERETFAARAIIWKPIQSPIAFIEWDMAGILVPKNMIHALLDCLQTRTSPVGAGG